VFSSLFSITLPNIGKYFPEIHFPGIHFTANKQGLKENLSHKRKKKYNAKENKSLKGHITITALNSCLVTLCNHTTRP
jgi:hypothetical protein